MRIYTIFLSLSFYILSPVSDKNECLTSNQCKGNEECFNTKGSFKCVDYSCPSDYKKIFKG